MNLPCGSSAWRTLAAPRLDRAIVLFIAFGLLMALAWARLAAPDIGLAEAAIGAGLTGALLAPFGCYALNLAAITAALCMSKEADADPQRRYLAACCAGFLYLLTGLLGATVASLFAALPQALIMAIAGLALLGTLGHSLHQALQPDLDREAAIITFLVTASGVQAVSPMARALASARESRELYSMYETLKKAREYALSNVSPAAVCGYLAWELR